MGALVCHNSDNYEPGLFTDQPVLNFTMMVSRCVSAKRLRRRYFISDCHNDNSYDSSTSDWRNFHVTYCPSY